MPQFDTFIFSSVLFYFILGFLTLLYINANSFLPFLGAILKLRFKLEHRAQTQAKQDKALNVVTLPVFPVTRKA